jgi:hypothetical protein
MYEGYFLSIQKILRCWLNNSANGFGRLIHSDGDVYLSKVYFILVMLEIGEMINQRATENIDMLTVQPIRVNG